MKRAIRKIISLIYSLKVKIVFSLYGIEGINNLLLQNTPCDKGLILKKYRAQIGSNVRVYYPLIIHNARKDYSNLKVGNDCHIGRDVFLDLEEPIQIGNRVTVSMRTTILTHFDAGDSKLKDRGYPSKKGRVVIGDDAYIGAGTTILGGVTVGEGALIAAGSLVNADIPPFTLAAGVPVKIKRSI